MLVWVRNLNDVILQPQNLAEIDKFCTRTSSSLTILLLASHTLTSVGVAFSISIHTFFNGLNGVVKLSGMTVSP